MECTRSNAEYDKDVEITAGGRKHRNSARKKKNQSRYFIGRNDPPIMTCPHTVLGYKGKKKCLSRSLTAGDVEVFRQHLFAQASKVEQDRFLLKFMHTSIPTYRRRTEPNNLNPKSVVTKYTVRKENGEVVPVCAKYFTNITGVTCNRLAIVARYFLHTGEMPKERRGGDRSTLRDKEITDLIKAHIKTYKCRESHYSRNKTCRSYLPPELNINLMWKQYCDTHTEEQSCSLAKFKKIFYNDLNLGFGNPHTDTCTTCKKFEVRIKQTQDSNKKGDLRTQLKLHKLRAKKFYQLMNKESPNTVKIIFDMQQNQPLPKLSVGEERKYVSYYVWLETESGRGANEVGTCVQHFLKRLKENFEDILGFKPEEKQDLMLFSDSCASQNKNTILMGTLIHFLEQCNTFSNITHVFPVRGHSYMPVDRIFGRIEKQYRKLEEMISPTDYYDILGKSGKLFCYGQDWVTKDLKTETRKIFKSKLPFKISETKVIQYKKTKVKVDVSVSTTYCGGLIGSAVLKRNVKSACSVEKAKVLPKCNMVSTLKRDNVKTLLDCVDIPEHAKQFYADVMAAARDTNGEDEENIIKTYADDENII
nr:unnamed protein product [Callosobruchus chinensis]